MLAEQLTPRFTVMSPGQVTTGAIKSWMVTELEQVDALPDPSVAVNITVLAPMLPQSN